MDFRIKAIVQKCLSQMPWEIGIDINYLLQRHMTHSWPLRYEQFKKYYKKKVSSHWEIYRKFLTFAPPMDEIRYFEFGAGWDLLAPIGFSLLGVKSLYVVDIEPVVRIELINDIIDLYGRMDRKTYSHIACLQDLSKTYRIQYDSPCDAAKTTAEDGTIDFIVTNLVLEHIPMVDIPKILNECYRILSTTGILSFQIDYADHYSYFDSKISAYNYLKYGQEEWKTFNCSLHYQNRLRHKDYKKFLEDAGFTLIHEEKYYPEDSSGLDSLLIHKDFDCYTKDELRPIGGWFVARK